MNKLIWQGYTVQSRMYSSDTMPMAKAQHVAQCGNESMGLMRSLHLKHCGKCRSWILWDLKDDQEMIA